MADGRPMTELEERIHHRFAEPSLLERALTHRSFAHEHPDQAPSGDNERLEFLGDAVLALLIAEALLARHPEMSEGELSKARSALCSATSLAQRARDLGLGEHLRLGRGEEKTGGREKPNLLADAYEAVVGAVFRDGGLDAARDVVLLHFEEVIGRLSEGGAPALARDFKSTLQEVLQQISGATPRYLLSGEEGPPHERIFRVAIEHGGRRLGEGEGPSKKAAAQAAAEEALARLENEGAWPPAGGEAPAQSPDREEFPAGEERRP